MSTIVETWALVARPQFCGLTTFYALARLTIVDTLRKCNAAPSGSRPKRSCIEMPLRRATERSRVANGIG